MINPQQTQANLHIHTIWGAVPAVPKDIKGHSALTQIGLLDKPSFPIPTHACDLAIVCFYSI